MIFAVFVVQSINNVVTSSLSWLETVSFVSFFEGKCQGHATFHFLAILWVMLIQRQEAEWFTMLRTQYMIQSVVPESESITILYWSIGVGLIQQDCRSWCDDNRLNNKMRKLFNTNCRDNWFIESINPTAAGVGWIENIENIVHRIRDY